MTPNGVQKLLYGDTVIFLYWILDREMIPQALFIKMFLRNISHTLQEKVLHKHNEQKLLL